MEATHREAFELEYGPEGTWAHLFRQDPAFIRTELIHDSNQPDRYVTLDFWSSSQSYDDFMAKHESEYRSIDDRMSALTRSETKLGGFEITVPVRPE